MKTRIIAFASTIVAIAALNLSGAESSRPNILWITSEDNGPHLGCYGDEYATTPHLDSLANTSLLYRTCWSNAPVCAPARTTIITGVYPTSTGAQHMRSNVKMPAFMKMYPQILREAGYYCTNNSKEDYNLIKPGQVWDESSRKAHWKNRKTDQPFFAIFNHTISHESQIRNKIDPKNNIHDPAKVRVPAYHPDTPEVRKDWAQYYDRLTMMDEKCGQNLKELEEAGLVDDTIIFYYGDHGSGMPRSKRWPYNSGLHVPLIVHIPEKFKNLRPNDYKAGGETDRLTSFVDLAPTLLSLIDIKPPEWMQGHAFAGKFDAGPQPFIYGYRGRMDERYDMVRSVTDGRYVYIRNYMPHKIYGQYIQYMFQTPTTRVWHERYLAGKLNDHQATFWQRKAPDELYDLRNDPDEVDNLARSKQHQEIRERLRKAQQDLAIRIRDLGFLPEGEMHVRAEGSTPYEMGHDDSKYDVERIMAVADAATSRPVSGRPQPPSMRAYLGDKDSAVRYWGTVGGLVWQNTAGADEAFVAALKDDSPYVRINAAQVLSQQGKQHLETTLPILEGLAPVDKNGIYISMAALNAIDELDARAGALQDALKAMPRKHESVPGRMGAYVNNLITKTLADLNR
jgi:uncharacterized sulfatase